MSTQQAPPEALLVVYEARWRLPSQRFRWKLVAANGRRLAHGGEGYFHYDEAERMGKRVCTGFYADAVLDNGTGKTRFEIHASKGILRSQRHRWRLKVNGRTVGVASEGYTHRSECIEIGRKVVSGAYAVSVYRA